jgi:hypothetical protein
MDIQGLNIDFTGIVSILGVVGRILLYSLIGIGIMFIVSYFYKYKHPLHLFIETGKGVRYKKDRGKKDRKNMKFLALKNKDIEFPYPETKYEYQQGKKSCLVAFVKNQSATWLEISENPHFIPADYDMQSKMINDLDATWNIIKKEPSFWEKYGQQMLWVGSLGIFFVIIVLILQRMDKIIEMGRSIAVAQASQGKQVVDMFLPLPILQYLLRKRFNKKWQ